MGWEDQRADTLICDNITLKGLEPSDQTQRDDSECLEVNKLQCREWERSIFFIWQRRSVHEKHTSSSSNTLWFRLTTAGLRIFTEQCRQLKRHSNLIGDLYLCWQSGIGVIHGWSSRCRSALCGHVEGAATSKWVSLGLGGRIRPH